MTKQDVPCAAFELDMMAAAFGECGRCGWIKNDHGTKRRQSLIEEVKEANDEADSSGNVIDYEPSSAPVPLRRKSSTPKKPTKPTPTPKTSTNETPAAQVTAALQLQQLLLGLDVHSLPLSLREAVVTIVQWKAPTATAATSPAAAKPAAKPASLFDDADLPNKVSTPVKSTPTAISSSPPAYGRGRRESFSHSELVRRRSSANLNGLDGANLEMYLEDEEFEKLFSVDRDTFEKMAAWKKNREKKKHGLF